MAKKVFSLMVLFCLVFSALSAQEAQEQEGPETQEQEGQEAQEQEGQETQEQEGQETQEQERQETQGREQQETQEKEGQEAQEQEGPETQEQEGQEMQEQERQETQGREQQETQEKEGQEAQEQEQQEAQARERQEAQGQGQNRKPLTLSAGAGVFVGGEMGGGVSVENDTDKVSIKFPYIGGGGNLFFDATYAEISFGIFGGGGSRISHVNLDIGLLGRYPFVINDKLSVFPLLGIDYQITVSAKTKDGDEVKYSDIFPATNNEKIAGDISALWFKFGGGLDYAITEKIYARMEALYGLRIANKFESTMKSLCEDEGFSAKILFGHSLIIKLGVGYKF